MRKLFPLVLLAAAVTACASGAPSAPQAASSPRAAQSAATSDASSVAVADLANGDIAKPNTARPDTARPDTGKADTGRAVDLLAPPPPPTSVPRSVPRPEAQPGHGGAAAGPMPIPSGALSQEQSKADRLAFDPAPRDKRLTATSPADGFFAGLEDGDGGHFESAGVNPLVDARADNLSTFAIDVDTGSFTLSRRMLESGAMPNAAGVRVEEWVNAFHYSYAGPSAADGATPFAIHIEGARLAKQSSVLRIGIQGKRIEKADRAPTHLTFLVDVSGSMRSRDRLPLAKRALVMLVQQLNAKDSVSLVTYAGATRLVLPATTVDAVNRPRVLRAIEGLKNGGGTNMGSGMELAYREANKALAEDGISRVIVLSDGDANIGHTSHAEILRSIKGYVSEGVTLSTVGFGTGNYRDSVMEQLADAGNGNYSYVGSLKDARKVFVDDLTGTLQVIAKDAKIQVEMNPDVVASYRLIGYENRDIADRDFRNDKVDAGEIGAGHTVTALYEVTFRADDATGNIATVRVRYKQPKGDKASEVAASFPAEKLGHEVMDLSADGRFAVGVGLAAEVFRHSPHMERLGIELADAEALMRTGATGPFASERKDFIRLVAPLAAGANVAAR